MNSWSSGSWKTTPTRRRISLRFGFSTGSPLDRDGPGARGEDAVEVQHQRGLARPVGPEQGDPLALVDVQVDPEQGLVAVGVGVGEAADVQDRRAHGVRSGLASYPRDSIARCTRSPRS